MDKQIPILENERINNDAVLFANKNELLEDSPWKQRHYAYASGARDAYLRQYPPPTPTVGAVTDWAEDPIIIAMVTACMREADPLFEDTGGGTRHYVRELLLPIMARDGLVVVNTHATNELTGEDKK